MARHGQRESCVHWPTLVEQGEVQELPRGPQETRRLLCPGSPDLPMKVVQESGAAQMLLLITETSQSNNSLLGVGGSGERGPVELEGVAELPFPPGYHPWMEGLSSEPGKVKG